MPAPVALAPLAWKAAQLGAVAAISYYAARRQRGLQGQNRPGPRDIWRETALNELDEGLETEASHSGGEARLAAAAKFKRGFRLGADGPGIEVEFATLTRLKFRRI
jgi:hypothetical protein